MKKRFGLNLLAEMMSMIFVAGSVVMPVQAGIFDKIKQSVEEMTEGTEPNAKEEPHELDFVCNEMRDTVIGDNGIEAEACFTRLLVNDDEHEKLNAVLRKLSDTNMELAFDEAREIAEAFEGELGENTRLYYSILASPVRTDSSVLSFWEDVYSFDGYTYDNENRAYNYDPGTGKLLRLEEIVQDHIDLERDLPQILGMAIDEIHDVYDFDQDIIDDDLTAYLSETYDSWYPHLEWVLGHEGVTFLIPKNTLSMYNNSFMITAFFNDFADFVKPEYTKISVESLNMLHENYMNLTAQKYWTYPEEEGASLYAHAEMELLRSDYSYELFNTLFSRMDLDYEKYSEEFLEMAEENKEKIGKDGWELKYTVKDRHRRADNKVLSFVRNKNVFSTSDGFFINENRGFNYDPVTGRELRLGNILEDKDIFADAFKNSIRIALQEGLGDEEYAEGMNMLAKGIKDGSIDACTDEFSWSLGYEGMLFFIDGSLLLGDDYPPMQISAFVPFKGNEKAIVSKYLNIPETYTVKILTFKDQTHGAVSEYMDLDGDGLPEALFFDIGEYTKSGKYTSTIAIRSWGDEAEPFFVEREVITEEDIQELNAYLVRTEKDGSYFFLTFRFQDDYRTYVYELTTEEILNTGSSLEGLLEYSPMDGVYKIIFGNPKDFTIYFHFPLLGTHYGYMTAGLNQEYAYPDTSLNGDECFHFDSYNSEMTLKRKLSGQLVDFTGEPYEEVTLKAGEKLQLYKTDEASFIDFFTEDDAIFRIEIEVEPGLDYLHDGRYLETYFEDVSFAVG